MGDLNNVAAYNYADFQGEEDWDGFQSRLHAGSKAPDATMTDLDGTPVSFSALWRDAHLMIEFGSHT